MTSPHSDDVFPVVIIGAGLAGLSAAIHLAARDVPPLVLEADTEWPGGRLSGGAPDTFEHNGRAWAFHSEHGAHALWGGYDNMRAMFERFIDIDLKLSYGEEWINRWGNQVRYVEAGTNVRRSWLPAPFHYLQLLFNPQFWTTITPLDFLSLPGFMTSLLWTTGFDPIMEQIDLPGLTINDYFRFWTPNLKATFRGLGHNLLAAPSEHITLAAFIAAIRFYTLLRRDTWQLGYLPANAHDCVIQPMIDKIEENGLVMRGARAVSLAREGDYWTIRVEDARQGGRRSLSAAAVILATEPLAAQTLLLNSPDLADRARAIAFPPTLRCATARLWFDAPPREGAPGGMFTGDFEIDNFFWLQRLHAEFAEWGEAGGSAIEVHFYAVDRVLDQPDHLLMITAATEVQRAFPELRGHFVHGAIRHSGRTQTQFMIPTAASLHVESPWPKLYACGDWIGYPTPALWMERCTVTGIAAANQVLAANGAAPWNIIPPREPEALPRLMARIMRIVRRTAGPVIGGLRRLRRVLSLALIALVLAGCGSGGDFVHIDESATQTAVAVTLQARANPSPTPGPSPTPLPTLEPHVIPTLEPDVDPGLVITRVGRERITLVEFRQQVRFERWWRLYQLQAWVEANRANQPLDLRRAENASAAALLAALEASDQFGAEAHRVMIIDAITVQEARRRGIEVDPYRFDAVLAQVLGLTIGPDAQLPPEFDAAYAEFLSGLTRYTGLTEEGFRRIIRARTLYKQLEFIIMNQPEADQLVRDASRGVEAHDLLLATEDDANEVVSRLRSGESLDVIASSLGFVRNADQQPRVVRANDATLPDAVRVALFAASPGALVGPVETSRGWYVAVVGDPVFDALPPDDVSALKRQYFLDWVESRMDDPDTVQDLGGWRDHIPADPRPADVSPLLSETHVILPGEE